MNNVRIIFGGWGGGFVEATGETPCLEELVSSPFVDRCQSLLPRYSHRASRTWPHPLQKSFLFNHITIFSTKGLEKSYDFTGTIFAAWVNPNGADRLCQQKSRNYVSFLVQLPWSVTNVLTMRRTRDSCATKRTVREDSQTRVTWENTSCLLTDLRASPVQLVTRVSEQRILWTLTREFTQARTLSIFPSFSVDTQNDRIWNEGLSLQGELSLLICRREASCVRLLWEAVCRQKQPQEARGRSHERGRLRMPVCVVRTPTFAYQVALIEITVILYHWWQDTGGQVFVFSCAKHDCCNDCGSVVVIVVPPSWGWNSICSQVRVNAVWWGGITQHRLHTTSTPGWSPQRRCVWGGHTASTPRGHTISTPRWSPQSKCCVTPLVTQQLLWVDCGVNRVGRTTKYWPLMVRCLHLLSQLGNQLVQTLVQQWCKTIEMIGHMTVYTRVSCRNSLICLIQPSNGMWLTAWVCWKPQLIQHPF